MEPLLYVLVPSTFQGYMGWGGHLVPPFTSKSVSGISTLQPSATVSFKGMTVPYLVTAVRTVKLCMCVPLLPLWSSLVAG